MLHRFKRRAQALLDPIRPAAPSRRERMRDALRAVLAPANAEIQGALIALDDHLDAVEWCVRHIAATREPALRAFLARELETERSAAGEALAAVRELDTALAMSLCRLLYRADDRLLGRRAILRHALLAHTAEWRSAMVQAPRDERYGT
jgi:hypothetical protein